MTANPFWGSISDQESKNNYRLECEYLLKTSRSHVRLFRLIIHNTSLSESERAILIRIRADLLKVIAAASG